MQFLLKLLSTQSLVVAVLAAAVPGDLHIVERAVETRGESYSLTTKVVGGPHGGAFNELSFVDANSGHKRIKSVTLGPCVPGEHVTYMALEFADFVSGGTTSISHGSIASNAKTAKLDFTNPGQRINKVLMTTWRKKTGTGRNTRLGWIQVFSNNGVIDCGAKADGDVVEEFKAPDKSSLLHFAGTSGDAIDSLQAFFIKDTEY